MKRGSGPNASCSKPKMANAGAYGATLHYLKAIRKAGTDEAQAVVRKMKEIPVNDFFTKNGSVREDGRESEHVSVPGQSPEELKYTYDYYKLRTRCRASKPFGRWPKVAVPWLRRRPDVC